MPRPRLCLVRFSRRIPAFLKAEFHGEAKRIGLTVQELNPNRRKARAVKETVPLVEKGTLGVFLDVKFNSGKGNNGIVISCDEVPKSGRLASRVSNRLEGVVTGVRSVQAVHLSKDSPRRREVKELVEVYELTKGRLVSVVVMPIYGDNSGQLHNNMVMEKQGKRIACAMAQSVHSFIESHL